MIETFLSMAFGFGLGIVVTFAVLLFMGGRDER